MVASPSPTPSSDHSSSEPLPQYPVSIWEGIAIALGAMLIVAVGLAGLAARFFNHSIDPQRATAIARSLMDYEIPGGSQGVFGANIGGAKVALVSSQSFPRNVEELQAKTATQLNGIELFIAKVPIGIDTETEEAESSTQDPYSTDFASPYRSGEDFNPTATRVIERSLCNITVPIRIQEGELVLAPQAPALKAIKYDAVATTSDSKRLVTLVAIGPQAAQHSEAVFTSLRCK